METVTVTWEVFLQLIAVELYYGHADTQLKEREADCYFCLPYFWKVGWGYICGFWGEFFGAILGSRFSQSDKADRWPDWKHNYGDQSTVP